MLDIDSPGGGVSASDYLYRSVLKVAEKKPVIASIRGLGASGAYYISCAAHKIVASHASIVGSIGVISVRPALQELMQRLVSASMLTRAACSRTWERSGAMQLPKRKRRCKRS